ncbi:UPF0481 protein At3g47200-like [Corylus avellana]|uniref:UPF0481 protein At3g47200-like n=1 Tax=Corylus avellana TaxID=13451 RepID=UPI00286AB15B|nr:UPF0481 protein At3g47200-like [Corylus avellana]
MEHIVSIDELHSRKVVRSKACEGSSSRNRPAITREERFRNFMDEGDQAREVEALGGSPPAKIQKVTFLLRDHKHFVKYFEPRVASLGPIHHGKPKYQLGEKYKLRLAYEFVHGKSINLLYEVEKEIKQLRECFEEEVIEKYDDEALAWILFVDGCAILQYILCATNDQFKELNIKTDSVAFAHQDLFLLENQVPYRLLKLLMSLSGKEEDLRKSIEHFIRNVTYQRPKQEERDPTHLLDLLRTTLLGPPRKPNSSRKGLWTRQHDPDWQSYRNLQELKAAGIHLKRNKNNVDDSTGPKFMNLIAYEMCLDFENDFGISSYMSFLDSLILDANDVKDLRKARVLYNFLGSDQEVANLFYEIGTELVPNAEAYKDVNFQIHDYFENHWLMAWMGKFYHNHFSAPWSRTNFVYSIILILGLTAIQAWYTVHPPPGPCDDFCKKSG